jgi:hypothetical protein
MDIDEAFSSQSEDMERSLNSDGRETTTDANPLKTKNIRKKYEPLSDGAKLVRFEDNPSEYKRLRKYAPSHLGRSRTARALPAYGAARRTPLKT